MSSTRSNLYFLLILFSSLFIIIFSIKNLSISYKELRILEENMFLIAKLANFFHNNFKSSNAFKVPSVLLHILNLTLIYLISCNVLRKKEDALISTLLYAMIPAVNIMHVLLNTGSLILFSVLLSAYFNLTKSKLIYLCFTLNTIFLDSSFIFFFAYFAFTFRKVERRNLLKNRLDRAIVSLCFIVNILLFGVNFSGKPVGRFLEIFSELSILYSPALFIYYLYTLYRNLVRNKEKDKTLLVYVSLTSIIFSFIVSIRQDVDKEIFLSMSLSGIPFMLKQFLGDLRVRLPMYRGYHKTLALIIISFLLLEFFILIFNKTTYLIVKNPKSYNLNSYYIAKELSHELKKRNIYSVILKDKKLSKRLEFYGINSGGNYKLEKKQGDINIKYYGITAGVFALKE